MIDMILGVIPGGGLTAIIAAIVAALGAVALVFKKGSDAGRDKEKAKEAAARAKNLERIKDASAARPVGGVHDDPRNRDNR